MVESKEKRIRRENQEKKGLRNEIKERGYYRRLRKRI